MIIKFRMIPLKRGNKRGFLMMKLQIIQEQKQIFKPLLISPYEGGLKGK